MVAGGDSLGHDLPVVHERSHAVCVRGGTRRQPHQGGAGAKCPRERLQGD